MSGLPGAKVVRHELEEYLGTGVDIFRFNPWAPSFKTRMLDDPVREETPIARGQYKEITGENLLEVGQEIAVEAGLKGGYAGISASVKSKFKRSEQRSEKTHFLMISFTHSGARLYLEGAKEQIRAQLIEEFSNALDTGDPDELIQEYGTHLVRKIIVGGRAEYYVRSSATSSMTSEEFELAARAKYDSLGGVTGEDAATGSIEASTKVGTKVTTKIKELAGNEFIDTIGGTAVSTVGIKSRKDWDAWAASIANRPAFLGFEEDGLMPIWELASDKARRTAIYQAYRRKAAKEFAPEILSVTSDVRNHPEVRVVVPEGYKLLCGGARDNYTGAGSMLTASFPESDNTWRASGKDHGVDRNMKPDQASVTAFALALYDPDDIWDVKIFKSSPSPKATFPEQAVEVESGYVMVGGGALDQWTGAGSMLVSSYPENNTTWRVRAKDHYQSDPATVTAYAVGLKCNVAGVKFQSRITTGKSNRSGFPQATVAPPSGYTMVGGGAAITYDGPGIMLTASHPTGDNRWEGKGKDHGHPDNGTIDVYCIGLKVEA